MGGGGTLSKVCVGVPHPRCGGVGYPIPGLDGGEGYPIPGLDGGEGYPIPGLDGGGGYPIQGLDGGVVPHPRSGW